MAIQHYGLDAAEIENLKAAHLTDDEINDLNKKRVKEQIDNDKSPNTSSSKNTLDDEFFEELKKVDSEINPKDYTEDYDDIDMINSKSINELKEMCLRDGSMVYDDKGEIVGPNTAYSRLLKLLEHKKHLQERGIPCNDNTTDWF